MRATATGLVMRGDLGIPVHQLDELQRRDLVTQLTREKRSWDEDKTPATVCAARHEDCCLWVPRYFDTSLWDGVENWEWTEGEPYAFSTKVALDPERGQPPAVPAMIEHLKQHRGGILVAPTGTGKTLMGCAIAGVFGRKIGVPVYVGHMKDNWIKHAKLVFGLTDDDIGIVQGDRCDIGKPVTLLSIQTLTTRGHVPEALQKQIGFLVCDEVHKHGAQRWREIVRMFPAKYRLGLSADPVRKDGLDDIVRWSFGEVGFRAKRIRTETVKPPKVRVLAFNRVYPENKYRKWKKDPIIGEWKMGKIDFLKYDKLLAADVARNVMFATEIANAARKGRQIIVLSSLVGHLASLRIETIRALDPTHPVERIARGISYPEDHVFRQTATLEAGLSDDERAEVEKADVIFATYMMAKDALNIPKLDTGFLATPPIDLTQPFGRLREKAEEFDRRDLMWVDGYENGVGFSKGRYAKRLEFYFKSGCEVKELPR